MGDPSSHGIHEISFLWYTAVGSMGTILGAVLATLYFGRQDPRAVDRELISPVLRSYWYGEYEGVASDDKNCMALGQVEVKI